MAVLARLSFYLRRIWFLNLLRWRATGRQRRSSPGRLQMKANGEIAKIQADIGRIALSRFCYRRRKTLAPQGPRKLPKLDVAGSTPVARSLSFR